MKRRKQRIPQQSPRFKKQLYDALWRHVRMNSKIHGLNRQECRELLDRFSDRYRIRRGFSYFEGFAEERERAIPKRVIKEIKREFAEFGGFAHKPRTEKTHEELKEEYRKLYLSRRKKKKTFEQYLQSKAYRNSRTLYVLASKTKKLMEYDIKHRRKESEGTPLEEAELLDKYSYLSAKASSEFLANIDRAPYVIYCITDSFTFKRYFGMTNDLDRRLKEHVDKGVIAKENIKEFTIGVVAWCKNKEHARKMEKFFIERFDTVNKGYNKLA